MDMPRMLRAETYRARSLRRSAPPAERALWQLLRGRRFCGLKFRRQHPIGPYVVDFFCDEVGLVIEADGARHFPRPKRDVVRDRWLSSLGLSVLRFPNREILHAPERVLARICDAIGCERRPSPFGRGATG